MDDEERKAKRRESQARFREAHPDYYKKRYEERKEAERAAARDRYWADPEAAKARQRAHHAANRESSNQISRDYRAKLKAEVYSHYGTICVCCGEAEPLFLSLDHINGGGYQHRTSVGGGLAILLDIRKRGFPPEFQILCFNCNLGRQLNGGICPHKE